MADAKISDLPADIAVLADGDKFPVADVSALANDTFATALEIKEYVKGDTALIRAASDYVLATSTTPQVLFPSPNTLTVSTGAYIFDGVLAFSGLSGTTGNFKLDLLDSGTAVLAGATLSVMGVDGTGVAANQTGTWATTLASPANCVTSTTSNTTYVRVKGMFSVTTAGTMIPTISLTNASGGNQLNQGSYLTITRLGAQSLANIGAWS